MENSFRDRTVGKPMIRPGVFVFRVERKILLMGRDWRFCRTGQPSGTVDCVAGPEAKMDRVLFLQKPGPKLKTVRKRLGLALRSRSVVNATVPETAETAEG